MGPGVRVGVRVAVAVPVGTLVFVGRGVEVAVSATVGEAEGAGGLSHGPVISA
jgi:hypothetical protein